MTDSTNRDFSRIDRPEILKYLFHPRPEWGETPAGPGAVVKQIPVTENVSIGACFHVKDRAFPNILFFHGNGEIVSDYHDLGPLYNRSGINFLIVDYRGYGTSTGQPTVASMISDCHAIFRFVTTWLSENRHTGPLLLMGRSLGSASALELAAAHSDEVDGLVIESGFAFAGPLLALLGAPPDVTTDETAIGFGQLAKIAKFTKPTLIIHAELDHIIPFSDGRALYESSGATEKSLLAVPGANHNDIFARALPDYLAAVGNLAAKTKPKSAR
jgi:fermentation-respiration switch protein FrsA (DUF1100 family)